MKKLTLIVNGTPVTEISCTNKEVRSVKKVLTKLGIYSSFHGYDFQFMETESKSNQNNQNS